MAEPITAWRDDVTAAFGEGLTALSKVRLELQSTAPPMLKLRRALSLCEEQIQALQDRQAAAQTAIRPDLMAATEPGQYWSTKAVKEFLNIDHVSIRTLVLCGALDSWQFLQGGGLELIDPATQTVDSDDKTASGKLLRIDGAIFWGPDVLRVREVIGQWREYARANGAPSYIGKPPHQTGFIRWYKNIYQKSNKP